MRPGGYKYQKHKMQNGMDDTKILMEEKLVNEFAQVTIRKIKTGNGNRIEIEADKLDYAIQLDPLQLESLTWQNRDVFSEFLRTPFGPENEE